MRAPRSGVQHARWGPDGQHILVTSDFQIRITIWSLVNKSSLHITGPKHAHRGMAFSPDQSLMAVLEVSYCDIARPMYSSRSLHSTLKRQG